MQSSPKLSDQTTDFQGCVYRVMFNHQSLPLWRMALQQAEPLGSPPCCARPDTPPPAPTIPGAASFTGFGYSRPDLQRAGITTLNVPVQFQLHVRTFAPQAVVLEWVAGEGVFLGVYLEAGRVEVEGRLPGLDTTELVTVRVGAERSYDDGLWYKVLLVY